MFGYKRGNNKPDDDNVIIIDYDLLIIDDVPSNDLAILPFNTNIALNNDAYSFSVMQNITIDRNLSERPNITVNSTLINGTATPIEPS